MLETALQGLPDLPYLLLGCTKEQMLELRLFFNYKEHLSTVTAPYPQRGSEFPCPHLCIFI